MTVSVPVGCRVWVLLEGASDVAAIRVVAERSGIDLAALGVYLTDMRGATNIRRHLLAATQAGESPRVLGMCDAPEARFFLRALRRVGCAVEASEDLPDWGFQVCDRDLEDVLMRDLGELRTREVLDELGLTQRFAMLTQQPAWVSETFHEQVHRFAGAASGRKELMAGALAAALDLTALPSPLAALLEALTSQGPTFEELRASAPEASPQRRHTAAQVEVAGVADAVVGVVAAGQNDV
jgi:hypothetical protein